MSCGCSSNYVQCCTTPTNCSDLCNSFVATNSWNIPAIGANAVLNVSNLKQLVVGTYIYHPSYGYFKIISFDATLGQLTVTNEGTYGNALAGVIIPAATPFLNVDTPAFGGVIQTFTPTFIPVGSPAMVFTPTIVDWANYKTMGNLTWISFQVQGTISGTLNNSVYMTLPAPSAAGCASYASVTVAGAQESGLFFIGGGGNTFGAIYRPASSNYALGATKVGATLIYG